MSSVADVAKELKVSQKTIRRWIKSGLLHAHRLGRLVRVADEDVAMLIIKSRT